jgi:16S rRNA (cytosine1402-N4)-methyltransferase
MNPDKSLDGKTLINTYPLEELTRIFKDYGELNKAYFIAKAIVSAREEKEIETTEDLKSVLQSFVPGFKSGKFWAQVFQGIRMEVNDEMGALHELLEQATEILKPGGRMVVMSYHSLEDRPVKNFFKTGNFKGEPTKDFYGNLIRPLNPITRKPIIAQAEEIGINPRSRSAKLRVAEKNQSPAE